MRTLVSLMHVLLFAGPRRALQRAARTLPFRA